MIALALWTLATVAWFTAFFAAHGFLFDRATRRDWSIRQYLVGWSLLLGVFMAGMAALLFVAYEVQP